MLNIMNVQNNHNREFSLSQIGIMTEETKEEKIKELEKVGYEYNKGVHVLLELEDIVPYNFVLYCLLIEDRKSRQQVF